MKTRVSLKYFVNDFIHFIQTILNFATKFAQKGYFGPKTEKVNFNIEFCLFDLV